MFTPGTQPPFQRPAPTSAVAVFIEASTPIKSRYRHLTMVADFGYGLRYSLAPGRNHVMVPPGHYRVQLYSQYTWWQVGKALLDIDTTRGPVQLYYTPPYTIYSAGAAGFWPQQRPGRGALLAIVIAAVLIPLLLVGVGLLLAP
ncbi:hypothetical protein DFR70_11168 [Nocardia tenerifensis]|uniref:Uncharacterized protein n=1 Tax=Nocardia tenerifensis TaxID=228006 RepID=A0A318JT30_9NOCA|nr:hypothetical protein DFR70_11168 [Nocardia tenerifensis]